MRLLKHYTGSSQHLKLLVYRNHPLFAQRRQHCSVVWRTIPVWALIAVVWNFQLSTSSIVRCLLCQLANCRSFGNVTIDHPLWAFTIRHCAHWASPCRGQSTAIFNRLAVNRSFHSQLIISVIYLFSSLTRVGLYLWAVLCRICVVVLLFVWPNDRKYTRGNDAKFHEDG